MSEESKDWICTVNWVPATPLEGMWHWTMWHVEDVGNSDYNLEKLAEGFTSTKLGIYWRVWRLCRKHGFKFWPNVKGTIPKDEEMEVV